MWLKLVDYLVSVMLLYRFGSASHVLVSSKEPEICCSLLPGSVLEFLQVGKLLLLCGLHDISNFG